MEEITKKNDEVMKNMEEISVKVQDFNIYDLFKGSGGEGGGSDISVALVQNLEKKVFKKFEFIDAKTKQQDEETYKLKSENGKINHKFEEFNKNFSNYKGDNEIIFNDFNMLIEEHKNKLEELDNKIDSLYKKIMEDLENKEKAFADIQNNMKFDAVSSTNKDDAEDKSRMSGNNFSEVEMKMVRDCAKKVQDIEKQFKILVNNINIDSVRQDVVKLQEAIATKANSNDLFEMKDNICNFSFNFFSAIFHSGYFYQR